MIVSKKKIASSYLREHSPLPPPVCVECGERFTKEELENGEFAACLAKGNHWNFICSDCMKGDRT